MSRRNKIILGGLISVVLIGVLAIVLVSGGGGDPFRRIRIQASTDQVNITMEMQQNAQGHTVAMDGNTARFTVNVSNAPGAVGDGFFADSLAPSVATARIIPGTRTVEVTGVSSGRTQILLTTAGGHVTSHVNVRVDIPTNSMEVRDDVHFALLRPVGLVENHIDFLENDFWFFPTTHGRNFDFTTTIRDVQFSLPNQTAGVRLEGNRIFVSSAAAIQTINVTASIGETRTNQHGWSFDFPVRILHAFQGVTVTNMTPGSNLNSLGAVIPNYVSLVRPNAHNIGSDRAELSVNVTTNKPTEEYGFMVNVGNPTLVHRSPITGSTFRLYANVEGETFADVIVYPRIVVGGEVVSLNSPRYRHLQITQRVAVEIKNVFEANSIQFVKQGAPADKLFAFSSPDLTERYEFNLAITNNINVNTTFHYPNNDRIRFEIVGFPTLSIFNGRPIHTMVTMTYSIGGAEPVHMHLGHHDQGVPVGADFSITIWHNMVTSEVNQLVQQSIAHNLYLRVFTVTQNAASQAISSAQIPITFVHSVNEIEMPEVLLPVVGAVGGLEFDFGTNLTAAQQLGIEHFSFGFNAPDAFRIELGARNLVTGRVLATFYIDGDVLVGVDYVGWIEFINGFRHEFIIRPLAQLSNLNIGVAARSDGHVFDFNQVTGPVITRTDLVYVRVGGVYEVTLGRVPGYASVTINMNASHSSVNIENFLFSPQNVGVFTLTVSLQSISSAVLALMPATTFEITVVVFNPVMHAWLSDTSANLMSERSLSVIPGISRNYRDSILNMDIATRFARNPSLVDLSLGWRTVENQINTIPHFVDDGTFTVVGTGSGFEIQGLRPTVGVAQINFHLNQVFTYRIDEFGPLRTFTLGIAGTSNPMQFDLSVTDATQVRSIQPLTGRERLNITIPSHVSAGGTVTADARGVPMPADAWNPLIRSSFLDAFGNFVSEIFDGPVLIASINNGVITAHQSTLRPDGNDIIIRLIIYAADSVQVIGNPTTYIIQIVSIFDQRAGLNQHLIESLDDWVRVMGFLPNSFPVFVAGQAFRLFRHNPNNAIVEGHFRLDADLDFQGFLFEPIPVFSGQIIGTRYYSSAAGGLQTTRHQIQNMTFVGDQAANFQPIGSPIRPGNSVGRNMAWLNDQEHFGLVGMNIGFISGIEFTNVTVNMLARSGNFDQFGRMVHFGVVAGVNNATGVIQDVSVHVQNGWYSMANSEDLNIGAIVGTNRGHIRENNLVSTSGMIRVAHAATGTEHNVNIGGIAGLNDAGSEIQGRPASVAIVLGDNIIMNSEITLILMAELAMLAGTQQNVGGIAGRNQGIINQMSSQSVIFNGTRGNSGGIAGRNDMIISQVYSSSAIYARGVLGGIVGTNFGTVQNAYYDLYNNPHIRDVLANTLLVNIPFSARLANPEFTNPFYAGLIVGADANIVGAADPVVGGVVGINEGGNVHRSFASSIFTNRTYFGPRTVFGLPYRGDIFIHGANNVIVGGVIGRQVGGGAITRVHSNLFINFDNAGQNRSVPIIGGVIGELATNAGGTVTAAYSYNYINSNQSGVWVGGIVGRNHIGTTTSFTLTYTILTGDQLNGPAFTVNLPTPFLGGGVAIPMSAPRVVAFTGNVASLGTATAPGLVVGWTAQAAEANQHFTINRAAFAQGPILRDLDDDLNERPLVIATPTSISLNLRTHQDYIAPGPGRVEIFGQHENNRGGFNYVIPASNEPQRAALFLTTGVGTAFTDIQANRYYLADLFDTVVEAHIARGRIAVTLEPVNTTVARLGFDLCPTTRARRHFITVLHTGTVDVVITSTRHEQEVIAPYDRVTFDVINGIIQQTVNREPMGRIAHTNAWHARAEMSNPLTTIRVQRGIPFTLRGFVDEDGWGTIMYEQVTSNYFDNGQSVQLTSAGPFYRFSFIPYFVVNGVIYEAQTFETVVRVDIMLGAIVLEIHQLENQIDAMSAAMFSGTLITNRVNPNMLADADERREILMDLIDLTFSNEALFVDEATTRIEIRDDGRNFDLLFTIEVESIQVHLTQIFGGAPADLGHRRFDFNIFVSVEVNPEEFYNNPPNAFPVGFMGTLRANESVTSNALFATARLNIIRQQVHAVVIQHFSDKELVTDPSRNPEQSQWFELDVDAQSPNPAIHTDSQVTQQGGMIIINTIPMFSSIRTITATSIQSSDVIGMDEYGYPIYGDWEVGLIQMVKNTLTGLFEPLGSGAPEIEPGVYDVMQISNITAGRHSWDGRIYLRTYIRAIFPNTAAVPPGMPFVINFDFLCGVDDNRAVSEEITLFAMDRPGLSFFFDNMHTATRQSVMAIGTSHIFEVETFGGVLVDWATQPNVTTAGVDIELLDVWVTEAGNERARYLIEMETTVPLNINVPVTFEFTHFVNDIPQTAPATLTLTSVLFKIAGFRVLGQTSNTIILNDLSEVPMSLRIIPHAYPGDALRSQIQAAVTALENEINASIYSDRLVWMGRNPHTFGEYRLNIGDVSDRYFDNGVGPHSIFDGSHRSLNFFLGRENNGAKFITSGLLPSVTNFLDVEMFFSVASGGTFEILDRDVDMRTKTTFNIVTVTESDEENPFPIRDAFGLANMRPDGHYILMEDITLNAGNWTPVEFVAASLDGNNRRIFFNGLRLPDVPFANNQVTAGQTVNIGVFSTIGANRVVKNLNIVLPYVTGGQGVLEINTTLPDRHGRNFHSNTLFNVGALAGTNNGIVTNVAVLTNGMFALDDNGFYVADFDSSDFDTSLRQARSVLDVRVNNLLGTVRVGGLVGQNMGGAAGAVISNSRVLVDVAIRQAVATESHSANNVHIGGFVGVNNATIVSSFFRDGNVINETELGAINRIGGFVGTNDQSGIIRVSYVMGSTVAVDVYGHVTEGEVRATRATVFPAGFVHHNQGEIENAYSNIFVQGANFRSGFVNHNVGTNARITNSFVNNPRPQDVVGAGHGFNLFANLSFHSPQSGFANNRVTHVDNAHNPDNPGWTLVTLRTDVPALMLLPRINEEISFEGFSISSLFETSHPNIWHMTDIGPRLVAPDHIAVSIRVLQPFQIGEREQVRHHMAYGFGTYNNPMVITNAEQFNRFIYETSPAGRVLTETPGVVLPGLQPYVHWDSFVAHRYIRLANNISLAGTNSRTFQVVFQGLIDGNSLGINGISVAPGGVTNPDRNDGGLRSIGLFSRLENATVRNLRLGFIAASGGWTIFDTDATYAGGLAGVAINSNIVDVTLTGTNLGVQGHNIVGGVVGAVVNFNYEGNIVQTQDGLDISDGNMGEVFKIENVTSNLFAQSIMRDGLGSTVATGIDIFFDGAEQYMENDFRQIGVAGGVIGLVTHDVRSGRTSGDNDASMFMRDRNGHVIPVEAVHYIPNHTNIQNITSNAPRILGEIAGGVIGVVEEHIKVSGATLGFASTFESKFYTGGVVGINMGNLINPEVSVTAALVIQSNSADFLFNFDDGLNIIGMVFGGIAGFNRGTINGGQMSAAITHANMVFVMHVGGAVGENSGEIIDMTVTGTINGGFVTGGLIGVNLANGTHATSTQGNVQARVGTIDTSFINAHTRLTVTGLDPFNIRPTTDGGRGNLAPTFRQTQIIGWQA